MPDPLSAEAPLRLATPPLISNEPSSLLTPVLVRWVDSRHGFGWRESIEPATGLNRVRSVGFLLHSDAESIVLSQSIGEDAHAQTIEIPRCSITSIESLS